MNQEIYYKIKLLQKSISSLSNGKATKLCIFGTGKNGIKLHNQLVERLVKADFVCDNNPAQWGYFMDNVLCVSPDELEKQKNQTLIVVTPRQNTAILKQLSTLNCPYIITQEQFEPLLLQTPKLRFFDILKNQPQIDYTSNQVQMLLDLFSSTIYNVLKSCEKQS